MAVAARERRRNQYEAACKVCSVNVAPGAGYLYSDTHSNHGRSRRRASGRWPKFVKCERCHGLNVSRKSQLPENVPPPLPRLGVDVLRAGVFRRAMVRHSRLCSALDPVIELLLPDGAAEAVACLRAISGEPIGCHEWYGDGAPCFGGRVLTRAAEKELDIIGAYAVELFAPWLNQYGDRAVDD